MWPNRCGQEMSGRSPEWVVYVDGIVQKIGFSVISRGLQ
jgi:hypothetical protein